MGDIDITQKKLQRRKTKKAGIFQKELVMKAIKQAFIMLNPKIMARNPVMFVTELGALMTTFVMIENIVTGSPSVFYTTAVTIILWFTVLFGNFAESLAEARGKAQADALKSTRSTTETTRLLESGGVETVSSDSLQKGDVIVVSAGEIIPADGEVITGAASVDESAITGESAPVIREAGGDRSGVTGGTRVLSDQLKIEITSNPGESFLDKMISLVEGASRQKTPNETALTVTLAGLTLAFVLVTVTLYPIGKFFGITLPIPTLTALLVCLIPTTIGALLAAIGLAGMDRALAANIIAKSGKAVELAGDIDTLLLDKTGTITMGNRQATEFYPLDGVKESDLIKAAVYASLGDETPEGKSIVILGQKMLEDSAIDEKMKGKVIAFSAQTRLSGLDAENGKKYRKGATSSLIEYIKKEGGKIPEKLRAITDDIARDGDTPIVVSEDDRILGAVSLSDVLKQGISERFARLRKMGLRIVMVTGDNPLTAAAIAEKAGVDDFIAEAKPEDKLEYIRKEQKNGRLVAMMGDGTNDAPALAQADIGIAMNSGTQAAKEAGNMVDLDSDPTKLIEVIEIGKQLLMTRGSLTTFSLANDIAKYFAIIPAMFMLAMPQLAVLNIMGLATPQSAILSALIFNALIIPALVPIAIKGVKYLPMGADGLLKRNLLIYGLGGIVTPFVGIKIIDTLLRVAGIA